jgi:hypothetical protein
MSIPSEMRDSDEGGYSLIVHGLNVDGNDCVV